MQPVSLRNWVSKQADQASIDRLRKSHNINHHVAAVLVARGISEPAQVDEYLQPSLRSIPDPALMTGITEASVRIADAIVKNERIVVFGDYDVDGVTSTALLSDAFRRMGANIGYHIPNRMNDGYGISADAVKAIASSGAAVMISVDCGITSVKEAALAKELGMDLVITDHHLPGDVLPEAVAVVDPSRSDCAYPYKKLAGVGVAFMLLIDVRRRLNQAGYFNGREEVVLREYLDLVALGTIADVAPITGVNRALVAHGLHELSHGKRIGISALKKVAELEGKVSCGDVGFKLGPRINAAGRLDDAAIGVDMLLSDNLELAASSAQSLNDANLARQEVEFAILAEAVEMIKNELSDELCTIVLAKEGWHPGVIGIVASRIVEIFNRPTWMISITDGVGKASGRSISGFNLHEATGECSDLLVKFGGHSQAAGLSIREENIQSFRTRFEQEARRRLTSNDMIPKLAYDVVLEPRDLTIELADTFSRLEPFGMGNPEPAVVIKSAQVLESKVLKEKHLKLKLMHGRVTIDAIAFNAAGLFAEVPSHVDVLGNLQVNVWNDRRSLQLRLKDIKRSANA